MKRFGVIVLVFIIFLLGECSLVFAQKKGKNNLRLIRMEVASGHTDNFHLVPMGENGLLVFYETNELNPKGQRLWYFALFDKHLKQKWLRPVPLTDKVYYFQAKQEQQSVFLVFRNSDKVKKTAGFYDILVYDISKQVFRSVQGTMPLKAELAGFAVSHDVVALGINLKKEKKADVLFVHTHTGNIHVVHITEPQSVFVDGVFKNPSNGTLVVVVSSADAKSAVRHTVYSFDPSSAIVQKVDISYFDPMSFLGEFTLASASGNNLKFFGADHLAAKGGLFAGNQDEDQPNTEGFFYLSIENGKQKDLRRFNFLDFKNIQGTFSKGEYYRPKGWKQKQAAKAPQTLALLNITHPEVHRTADGFLVSANAYAAYYKTESRMDYDFYGNMYPTNYRVFAGYLFYDVILGGFSVDGKKLWDNDFPLENILSYRIGDKALVYPDSTIVTLAYVSEGQIITQDIYRDKKLDAVEKVNIASRYSRDRPVGAGESLMIHWYDRYFLVYGYQQLKNRALQNQPLRTVFYVNKVTLQ